MTSKRFDAAVKKLYLAFHDNTLNPEDCKQCAVGNILDQTESWKYLTEKHGAVSLSYLGHLNQNLGRRFGGYTPLELLAIERAFLIGCGYTGLSAGRLKKPERVSEKDVLFNGLSKVITCLCRLDGIRDVMDCSELFDFKQSEIKDEALGLVS